MTTNNNILHRVEDSIKMKDYAKSEKFTVDTTGAVRCVQLNPVATALTQNKCHCLVVRVQGTPL